MQALFSTKPVSLTDGLLIVVIGVLAMAIGGHADFQSELTPGK